MVKLLSVCTTPTASRFDLTADVCRERNIKVDEAGFDAAMEEQRRRAREASGFGADYNAMIVFDSASEFEAMTIWN